MKLFVFILLMGVSAGRHVDYNQLDGPVSNQDFTNPTSIKQNVEDRTYLPSEHGNHHHQHINNDYIINLIPPFVPEKDSEALLDLGLGHYSSKPEFKHKYLIKTKKKKFVKAVNDKQQYLQANRIFKDSIPINEDQEEVTVENILPKINIIANKNIAGSNSPRIEHVPAEIINQQQFHSNSDTFTNVRDIQSPRPFQKSLTHQQGSNLENEFVNIIYGFPKKKFYSDVFDGYVDPKPFQRPVADITSNKVQESQNIKTENQFGYQQTSSQPTYTNLNQNQLSADYNNKKLPINYFSQPNYGDGNYNFEFESENGILRQEQGHLINPGSDKEESIVEGIYSYIGPEGVKYTVTYKADADGFHATGDHIPTSPDYAGTNYKN